MSPRGDRENDGLLPSSDGQYHDDEPSPQNEEETGGQNDALSFLAIDGEAGAIDEEDLSPIQRKHFLHRYIPPKIRRAWQATVRWCEGPDPPRPWKIEPFFEPVQTAPIRLLDTLCPKPIYKFWLLIAFYIAWLLVFSLVLWKSAFAADVPGYGAPVSIGCGARFWSKGNGCGLNGDQCRPFENTTFTFRCPASCSSRAVLEPYAVGDQEIIYRALIVGGPPEGSWDLDEAHYRGDSFICGAAIHAGYLSNTDGGCGVVKLTGEYSDYPRTRRHTIDSIAFDSYFPLSYTFVKGAASQCQDLRWPLLAVTVTFSVILSLFTTSPGVFFWTIFTALFAHVGLVSDPPGFADYRQLISTAIGRFLPSAFVAYVLYITTIRHTLTGLRAQIEKTALWLGACWLGSLNNYTFDKIPISRLTPHDLQQQPGAVPSLIIIIVVLISAALWQAWTIRVEGKMPKYLAVYGIMAATLIFLVAIPTMKIRIHHYILALLLLPGTFPQTRPSLIFQGLLIGLFINGIARWGYDPILQTDVELRGDAPIGSRLPQILPPIIHNNFDALYSSQPNITFEWEQPPVSEGYDGISILVNDVERFKGYLDQGLKSFTWVREKGDVPEYFRFAFMRGSGAADYTKAGVWTKEGGWYEMEPGPSK